MATRAVLVVLCLAACSSAPARTVDNTPAASSTVPSGVTSTTTSTITSTTATTATGATSTAAPTTVVGAAFGFQPGCTAVAAHGGAPADATPLDTLGPLGHAPTLRITLPMGTSADQPDPQATQISGVRRIPGGVLIAIGASEYGFFDGAILTAINSDGSVRWVRCAEHRASSVAVAPAESGPTTALVNFEVPHDGGIATPEWHRVSLATGADQDLLSDVATQQGVTGQIGSLLATGTTSVLLGPWPGSGIDPATQPLMLVNLEHWTIDVLPYPPLQPGQTALQSMFAFTPAGEPALVDYALGTMRAVTVFHNGAWSTQPSLLQAANGPTVTFYNIAADGSDDRSLHGYSASGAPTWHNANITSFGGEGFDLAVAGAITVVSGCFHASLTDDCAADAGIAGIDTATGRVRWKLAGRRSVSLVADGLALVTDAPTATNDGTYNPGAWMMIDITSGKPVSSERWTDPETFRQGCCGESGIVSVNHDGALVFAANYQHLAIWYPADANTSPHDVTFG